MSEHWTIIGATSVIARAISYKLAKAGNSLLLVARDKEELERIKRDLIIRYQISVQTLCLDMSKEKSTLKIFECLKHIKSNSHLVLAHAHCVDNDALQAKEIHSLVHCNITTHIELIHFFCNRMKKPRSITYLSSVAADRGREKNSLYGASKKSIEVYISGLKGKFPNINFLTLRLGFIDTRQTYGKPGIFLPGNPQKLANYIIRTDMKNKTVYYPFFWRYIMILIKLLPERLFIKLGV